MPLQTVRLLKSGVFSERNTSRSLFVSPSISTCTAHVHCSSFLQLSLTCSSAVSGTTFKNTIHFSMSVSARLTHSMAFPLVQGHMGRGTRATCPWQLQYLSPMPYSLFRPICIGQPFNSVNILISY